MIQIRLLMVAVLAAPLFAGEPEVRFERGVEYIRSELNLARTGIRAMSVAAHPDDEDGATLSYLRRTLGVETHMCLVTRGEGGQNEAGPELGAALAVVRSRETEAAAKILGAKVWYLNQPDFGFSKSKDETLKVWDHDKALAQLVRVIRIVRPHILFMNHDPDGSDHGHHRASGQLTVEAFDAAADPAKFAEQMKEDGTKPWAVSKLYLRRFAPPGTTLAFDANRRDPNTGQSATEIAALALSKHASQGMLRDVRLGEKDMRYFALLKSRVENAGDDVSMIHGIPRANDLDASVDAALKLLERPAPLADENVVRQLGSMSVITGNSRFANAFLEAAGIHTEVEVGDALITTEEPAPITVRVANRGALKLRAALRQIVPESAAWEIAGVDQKEVELNPGGVAQFSATATAKPGAFPSFPHDENIFARIETRTPLSFEVEITIPDIAAPRKPSVVLSGSVPLDLALPFSAKILPEPVLIFDDPQHAPDFRVRGLFRLAVTNHRRLKEPLKLFAGIQPQGDVPVDRSATLTFKTEDETQSELFRSMALVDALNRGDVAVQTAVWTAEKNFGGPVALLRRIPLKLPPVLSVALVKTYDEATHEALKKLEAAGLGLSVTLLSDDDLRAADLNRFHTIVLDIRATQYRPEVRRVKDRLAEFMESGGNIVCMYHKDFDWNPAAAEARGRGFFRGEGGGGEIAPFPIELAFSRVTDETAPVRVLKPEHPLLNEPCKIFERDFAGWVQERGVYFPKKWAPQYSALLSVNDPNEAPLDGGLLAADVGRGSFIYTSFVWYRQLRAGNPGAFRIFANLISYPRVRKREP